MRRSEYLHPLSLPDEALWSSIGTVVRRELPGGHQSRVFAGERSGKPVVVKLVDRRLADPSFRQRVVMTAVLAECSDSVVGPIPNGEQLVADLGGWLAVIYPFVEGRSPGIDDEHDVRRAAAELAKLHRALRALEPADLPVVAALAGAAPHGIEATFGPPQLLHGDFSTKNLIFSGQRVRVIDFDDCGYGPIAFEVGNTLYMELFDAFLSADAERYERFRVWFVDEYRAASGVAVADELIDEAIELRVSALAQWIDDPDTAPIGIRTATPAWRETLRSFVSQHRKVAD